MEVAALVVVLVLVLQPSAIFAAEPVPIEANGLAAIVDDQGPAQNDGRCKAAQSRKL